MWNEPRDGPAHRDESLQVVCFYVGEQEYAVDIMRIKEIVNPLPITRVPSAPAFVEGMIELRGAFMAVIDLRKRFGLEATELARDGKYIVVSLQGQNLGLVVDGVVEVRRISRCDIAAAPDAIVGPRSQFVVGVIKWDDRIVMLIELEGVLDRDEYGQLGDLAT